MPVSTALDGPDRRLHLRQRPASLAYAELGSDNGGIVLNAGEGGLAVAAVAPLAGDDSWPLRFRLSPSSGWIKATGQVAWLGKTQKEAGIRFVDLDEDSRARIRVWISSQPLPAGAAPPLHVPASFAREAPPTPPALQPPIAQTVVVPKAPDTPHPLAPAGRPERGLRRPLLLAALFFVVALSFFVIGIGAAGGSLSDVLASLANKLRGSSAPAGPPQTAAQNPVPAPSAPVPNAANAPVQSPPQSALSAANPAPAPSLSRIPGVAAPPAASERVPLAPARPRPATAPSPAPLAGSEPPIGGADVSLLSAPPAAPAQQAAEPPPLAQPAGSAPARQPAPAPAAAPPALPQAAATQPPAPAANVTAAVDVAASPYPSIRVPPELQAQASRPGTNLHLGALTSRVEPVYPPDAIRQGIQGLIQLRVVIGRDGSVADIQLISGGPLLLVEAARTAIRQWHYEPSLLGAQPVEAEEQVTVNFHLISRAPSAR